MILTDDQKEQAKALGLIFTELSVALRTRIAPETYAKHKQEMQAERDAWDAKMEDFAAAVTESLRHAVRRPGGVGLSPEEPTPESE